jgi:hypothetical protein
MAMQMRPPTAAILTEYLTAEQEAQVPARLREAVANDLYDPASPAVAPMSMLVRGGQRVFGARAQGGRPLLVLDLDARAAEGVPAAVLDVIEACWEAAFPYAD